MSTAADFNAMPAPARPVNDAGSQSQPHVGFQPYRASCDDTQHRHPGLTPPFPAAAARPGAAESNATIRALSRPFDVGSTQQPFTVPAYRCACFLARDAFVRSKGRAIAMMFVRLCVCLGLTCIVIIRCTLARIYLYGWIYSAMFWAP